MKKLKYIFILIPILFVSCSKGHVTTDDLAVISKNMLENPEMVLDTLSRIKVGQLKDKKANALYALLYTQAKDKSWIDETDDSLITIAVNYFERSRNVYYRFLSYFYWGRVNQNGGNLTKAIVAFTKAEDMVEDINDKYSVGLLYANLGLLFQSIYDYPKSLEAFRNAYDYYMLAEKYDHAMYTKLNIGNILHSTKQFDNAEKLLLELLEWGYNNNDYVTARDSFYLLANTYEQTNNIDAIMSLFASKYFKICKEDFRSLQYQAYIYTLKHNYNKAEECLQNAWNRASKRKDSATLFRREYTIFKLKGEYERALYEHEKLLYDLDTEVRKKLQQPVLAMQKDYYKEEANYNALLYKQNKEKLVIISVSSIIVLILMFVIHIYRIKARQKRIEGYMDKIQDLEACLLSVDENRIKIASEMNEKISNLFANQFSLIDKLSTTYYETHGTSKDRDAIYNQVTKEIEKLSSNKKYLYELENIVNTYKDNIMQKTREAMPQFSEMDLRMLCFFYAGFSAKAISIFTNNSTGNIYTRKKRLKEKISLSESLHKETILEGLS